MSNVLQVGATTITNTNGSSYKFYTIHVIGDLEVRQYGRIGTQGQFQYLQHSGKRAAEESAKAQIVKKERGGYGSRTSVIYALSEKYLGYSRDQLGSIVHTAHLAAKQDGGRVSHPDWNSHDEWDRPDDPQPETSIEAAFDIFNERALNVIGAAAGGDTQVATTYATLREEFTGMEDGIERCRSLLETLEVMLAHGGEG